MNMGKKRNLLIISLCLTVLALGLLGAQFLHKSAPLRPIVLQLDWFHNASFVGYYIAKEKGFFSEEGLSVNFLPGDANVSVATIVYEGRAQFGVAAAYHLLRMRAANQALQAIACIFQRNPLAFISLAESGIHEPRDFVGQKIFAPKQQVPVLKAMLARVGVPDGRYLLVDSQDMEAFLAGDIPIMGAYLNGTIRLLQNAGHQLNIIFPDDFGAHVYQQCLFTTDRLIAEEPDLVRRFLRAALAGWHVAINQPSEAGNIVLRYTQDRDAADLNDEIRGARPYINIGETPIGWMQPEIWADMVEQLVHVGMIDKTFDPSSAYTLRFLRDYYDE